MELLEEREQLKHAMESRPVIDMARGVLIAGLACQPEEAWEILVTVSQHANIKLRDVAEAITSAATGKPMPEVLQEHLAAAVRSWQADRA
ncbi:ANTAR domain-containing protein [Streptomyces sp. NPDC000983]|uniref:ANTAR domain-containing protein n=1 Tax=Streptomyces sp. NPDC000983 TaxID=3154373 RepID=UPI003333EDCF